MTDLASYLQELQAHLKTDQAREHTYRPAVERLFASFTDVQAANDQARTEHGATDFVFRKKSNTNIILGYAEAKDIDANLDKTEKTEQLERYAGYDNLILTNYIEFRFYQNGKRYAHVEIAKLDGLSLASLPENFQNLKDELASFFEKPPEKITSARRLSQIMGAKARRIRTNIDILLKQHQQDATKATEIYKIYELMQKMLVHDMLPESFADMYAQTLVYGLFVARYDDKTPKDFSRQEARDLVPNSNPFLRQFFDHIAGSGFEKRLAIIVDELCEIFAISNIAEIINKYLKLEGDDKQGKDPVIHFYEDFLSEYDPAERKKMGAYYTPLPVVDYMVRAVDEVLKNKFNIPKGLAESSTITKKIERQGKKLDKTYHKVQVLDPATGTATFLNEIIKFVHTKFKGQEGQWPAYARDSLIPRLSGFELMMGAYTIAHLKLGLTLKNLGVDDIGKRLGIYLTNSLEEGIPTQPDLFSFGLAGAVTEEATQAAEIKTERPIMVIIGNPPYSVSSSNKGEHIQNLIKVYKQDLNERKINLDDDYIKFIRFSEDMISKNGEGIVAMITNNSFLDGVTHRQMRKHLLETFDDIYILDLHGNSKKKEVAPDGSKDENVFDIQQGVSISIFIKNKVKSKKLANVYHQDLFGKRTLKFSKLDGLTFSNREFTKLNYQEPYYFFVPKDFSLQKEYKKGFSVSSLFKMSNSGVKTDRDSLFIDFDKKELAKRFEKLLSGDYDEKFRSAYRVEDSGSYKLTEKIKGKDFNEEHIMGIQYRPFDFRSVYYDQTLISRPGYDVVKHLLNEEPNITLNLSRTISSNLTWKNILINSYLSDVHTIGDQNYSFPLWLYDEQGNKSSNLNAEIVEQIKLKAPKADEQAIFDYIYGILHWPAYRKKYKEFLKIDFPRVPYPKDTKQFEHFKKAGEELRKLHLMADPRVNDLITTFPAAGTNQVTKLNYEQDRVYINEAQYFGGVPELAWNFYIGGYQPAQKWLKDRKGRTLSSDDIEHYQKIIKVLNETERIMKKIE